MKNRISACLGFSKQEDDKDLLFEAGAVDVAWCSEACKQVIKDHITKKYPCKQKFVRVDVIPLHACDPQRYYRVSLWVHDWSSGSIGPLTELWKTFYVTLEGAERKVVAVDESRKVKLVLGEKGNNFMREIGIKNV